MLEFIGIFLVLVVYLAYKFWPNSLSRKIKHYTFEGVDDETLLRFAKVDNMMNSVGRESQLIDIAWKSWNNFEDSNLDLVLRVLGGYGGLFWRLIELRRFYFREVLSIAGNLSSARGWINSALRLGIIREEKDQHGVKQYVFNPDRIKLIVDVLDSALGELIHG